MYEAKILCDSVNPEGVRLTTFQITFPRIVLAEFNTHRAISRNSASSRAIPVLKRIQEVQDNPFIPNFGRNQKGMQPGESLDLEQAVQCHRAWDEATRAAVIAAQRLEEIGVHKQWANRLLEPFLWHTVIATATEWSNFFNLRCHPDAQEEIRTIATMMRDLYHESSPYQLWYGDWHLPLVRDIDEEEILSDSGPGWYARAEISAARCARVSYLTHDGRRDHKADLELYQRLVQNGHLSPLEHAVMAADYRDKQRDWGNLAPGWLQLRKLMVEGERDILGYRARNTPSQEG